MNRSNFYITAGVIGGFILVLIVSVIVVSNTAIGYEETISEARSSITIQEKRQVDLIGQLVQVVQENSRFESSTQLAVTQARNSARAGDINNATTVIAAVAEQYPELKASAAYVELMTELSVSENLKAQYRVVYNDNVLEYNRFVRRFPQSFLLSLANYEVVKFDYLNFTDTEMPDQLFPNP